MYDQDRISPYNINTKSRRQEMGIKKISIKGLLIDLIPNSPNPHHKNRMAESKENYSRILDHTKNKIYVHFRNKDTIL